MKESFTSNNAIRSLKRLRLAARIVSILLIVFFLLISIEGINNNLKKSESFFTIKDKFAFATLLSLILGFVGLVIAFWNEVKGALISLIGFLCGAIFLIIDPALNFSTIYFILLIPSAIYFIYWNELRKNGNQI